MPLTKFIEDQAKDSDFVSEAEFPHNLEDVAAHPNITGTPQVGDTFRYNGTHWEFVPLSSSTSVDLFCVTAARNRASVSDIYLQWAGNVFSHRTPFLVPFDAEIVYVAATCRSSKGNNWEIHVYINGIDVLTLDCGTNNSAYQSYSGINVNAGDRISIYHSGGSTNRPCGIVYFKRV